jgi:ABC-2 type transport system ATP-binding protein
MNLLIETTDLGKRYGPLVAVEHLCLRVAEGEIYAFLGLNGAGKTTTMRLLLGMIRPTWGSAQVLHTRVRPGSRKPWAAVGYLVEAPHSYQELTVRENLDVARRLHPGTPPQAVGQIIERLGLATSADRRAATLSQGNAQRLGLARALLHAPRLLLLDEPTNGLDPAGIVEVRELLLELTREQGVTVFLASHLLAEVARLARRVGILHQGHLLQELDVAELARNQRRWLLVRARDTEAARLALASAGHCVHMLEDGTLELAAGTASEHPDEIASLLVGAGAPPTQVLVAEEDLEQYFLRIIGMNGGHHA